MPFMRRPSTLWIATLVAAIVLVVLLRAILLPFLAGVALAYLLDPVVDRLHRFGLSRTVAAFAMLSLFIVAVGGVAVVAIPIIGTEIADLIEKIPGYIEQLQASAANPSRPWLRKIIGEGLSEAEQSAGEIATFAANWIPSLLRSLWSDSQSVISALSLLTVTPIVTFYLLKDWKRLIATINHRFLQRSATRYNSLQRSLTTPSPDFFAGRGQFV
jgi:predicted PurR-regulated permease PerM